MSSSYFDNAFPYFRISNQQSISLSSSSSAGNTYTQLGLPDCRALKTEGYDIHPLGHDAMSLSLIDNRLYGNQDPRIQLHHYVDARTNAIQSLSNSFRDNTQLRRSAPQYDDCQRPAKQ